MITTDGKRHIKNYMGGIVPSIGGAIAYGLGSAAALATDETLQFEFGRGKVTLTSYDFIDDVIVFKATLPPEISGKIYEVGLFSQEINANAAEYGSRVVTSFDQGEEAWNGVHTWNSTNARIGNEALRLAPAASGTAAAENPTVMLDFGGNSDADQFRVAFYNGNTNAASISILFLNDSANYYTYTISNPAAGYSVVAVNKGSFTAVGAPWWSEINSIRVAVVAKSSGAAAVDLDGIRIEDTDTVNTDYVLVARNVITPHLKEANKTDEIEIRLPVNIA